jgi:hypothetical protein
MAYTLPTPAEIKARFPAFAGVDNSVIQSVLTDEVPLYVGQNWINQANYTQGAMLYTAHALTLDGFGTGSEAIAAGKGLLGYQSITSGRLSLTRFSKDGTSNVGSLSLTSYGQRFIEIRRINAPGPVVAADGTLPVNPWDATFQSNDGSQE